MKPKAYLYVRFSSEIQKLGHSLKRQTDRAKKYCKEHDLNLDESTFEDLGVSAFKSKNATEGALNTFTSACDLGKIEKGSYLLVESLDRLSRDEPLTALKLLEDILKKGVLVVTLLDQKIYNKSTLRDTMWLLQSVLIMGVAYEESVKKSDRIGKAWAEKRELAKNGGLYSGKIPTWLKVRNGKYEPIEDRSNIIKRIFSMALAGNGKAYIARHLNDTGVVNWNKPKTNKAAMWHPSFIYKILTNKAVYGVLTTPKFEEEVENYYPIIVPHEDFLKAELIRDKNRLPVGKSINTMSNLFTRMCLCECGASMHYLNKGSGLRYLVCSHANSKNGKCKYVSFKYSMVEQHIIYSLREMDYSMVFQKDTTDYQGQILIKKDQLAKVKNEIKDRTLGVNFAGLPDSALQVLKEELDRLHKQGKELKTVIGNLKDKMLLANENSINNLALIDKLFENKSPESILESRRKLHAILIDNIKSITFKPIRELGDINALDEFHHSQIVIKLHNSNKKRYINVFGKRQDKSSSYIIDESGAMTFDTDIIAHSDRVDRFKTAIVIEEHGGMSFSLQEEER